ncbi:MAG: amidoligase family protein [Oscillospiraceae bacterium]|jgi:hypothetical protein|nr:amidoligase family protein [Oscillospiraceae bacterium]
MTETYTCARCGESLHDDDTHYFDDEAVCLACLDEDTILCDHCGDRIWRDDSRGDENLTVCEGCYEDHYTTCEGCSGVFGNDEVWCDDDSDDYLCEDCHNKRGRSINSYSYKPYPIFYGDGERYFGVELEIDHGGENSNNADILLEIANGTAERLYCKRDGSLHDGFELVTHPMTPEYHQSAMPWGKILSSAIDMGYTSHNAGTCGLHVHVNRSCLGESAEAQDAVIARILYFVETHWVELLRFSRRTQRQMESWAARYGRHDNPKETLDTAKDSFARYRCVNLCNHDTIEFRMFRGTLKLNTLIATLQLVNEIVSAAISLSDAALDDLSWSDFAEQLQCESVPELITYLKERRLYVNEPVAVGEEI